MEQSTDSVELDEEHAYLDNVIKFIDSEVSRIESRPPATTAYQATANNIQKNDETVVARLRESRPNPYFGRIDFIRSDDSQSRAYYIGRNLIGDKVYSWTTPMAALFYKPAAKGYDAPAGFIAGHVELKRQYQITDAKLESYNDVLRLPARAAPEDLPPDSDESLIRTLSSSEEGEMQDVVETIQPEQYEHIAAINKPVVIIQGAAGSGKSIVGLHRLAFLLSPHSHIGTHRRPQSRNVIMFGPSATFLSYVANLLPSLGQHNIQQTTVRNWIINSFSKKFQIERDNRMFLQLMNYTHRPSEDDYEAERFKGSIRMADILERHVKSLRADMISSATDIRLEMERIGPIIIRPRDVNRFARALNDMPLNDSKIRLIERLAQEFRSRLRSGQFKSNPSRIDEFANRILTSVESQVTEFWPTIDFTSEYTRLLSSPKMMIELGGNSLKPSLANLIAQSISNAKGFGDTDLAPMLFLDRLLNEHRTEVFDHIVIDEAQDISPIEFAILKQSSRNGWFTILGDIRQKLLPFRGLDNWRQVSSIFQRSDTVRYESRISYRSTNEITRFCNRILRKVSGSTSPPIPYARHGDSPTFLQHHTQQDMFKSILDSIGKFEHSENASIGVLAKTKREAMRIHSYLREMSVADVNLLTPTEMLKSGVTVSPILLTKGLEFDAVVVAGVNDKNFKGTEFDNRLLYLACTRAKHQLSIQWFGRTSPSLPTVKVTQIPRKPGSRFERMRRFNPFSKGRQRR